ncbi:hypothetical protein [Rhodococcus triatomae]
MGRLRYIAAAAWAAAIAGVLAVIGIAGLDLLASAFVWATGLLGGVLALLAGHHRRGDSHPGATTRTAIPAADAKWATRPEHVGPR